MASSTQPELNFDQFIPRSPPPEAASELNFNNLIPTQSGAAAQPAAPAQSPVTGVANSYLNGLTGAAGSGLSQMANSFSPSPAYAQSIAQERNASPFDISGEIQRLGMTGSNIGSAIKGAFQVAGSPLAPIISAAGHGLDAITPYITPSFTPQEQQQIAASGVKFPTGEQMINTALMGMRPSAANPIGTISKPPPIAAGDVKTAATDVYNDAAVRGTAIPRQAVNNAIGQAMNDLRTFRPSGGTDAFSILDEMKQANNPVRGKNGQFQKSSPITADDLDSWSGTLGNLANETQLNQQGLPQATPKAAAAAMLKNKVDDLLATHVPGWAEADANYAAAKAAEGLDRRSVIADIKSGGGDYAAKLAQQAKTILLDPRVASKFSPEDIAQLKTISQGGALPQRTLNWLGTQLGSRISHGAGAFIGGMLGASHAGAEGAGAGFTAGAVADAILARGLMSARNSMASNRVKSVVNSVLQNSPYGRSLAPIPVSPPNPFLSGIPVSQFIPRLNFGNPMFGVMPAAAKRQQ